MSDVPEPTALDMEADLAYILKQSLEEIEGGDDGEHGVCCSLRIAGLCRRAIHAERQLAAEREARLKLEARLWPACPECGLKTNLTEGKGIVHCDECFAEEQQARLRAEAVAAGYRTVLSDLQTRAALARNNCLSLGEVNSYEAGVWGIVGEIAANALLSADTGSRLAAWLEQVRGMPCLFGHIKGCFDLYGKSNQCLRCRTWEAMGWKS